MLCLGRNTHGSRHNYSPRGRAEFETRNLDCHEVRADEGFETTPN